VFSNIKTGNLRHLKTWPCMVVASSRLATSVDGLGALWAQSSYVCADHRAAVYPLLEINGIDCMPSMSSDPASLPVEQL